MRPLGVYVHVPFCASRCGYCDFNTYVPDGEAEQILFVAAALRELERARAELGERVVGTIFFGGGTPTLLGARPLVKLLEGVGENFALADDAEITTEANPESVDLPLLRELRQGGFSRISLGMQSASEQVLHTLDRRHRPGRATRAAGWARQAGFAHVSLDLIYGTPGESDREWEASLEAALAAEIDHLSAYALAVKPGTALAAKVRRGTLPAPDGEAQARRYRIADERCSAAGMEWYELCSWAAGDAARCRHNLGYWHSHDWWGIGPGAYSHIDGVRWSNVKHPGAYAKRLADGETIAVERESLSTEQRRIESVLLGLRTREGVSLEALSAAGRRAAEAEVAGGSLLVADGRAALTAAGRLLADRVTAALAL